MLKKLIFILTVIVIATSMNAQNKLIYVGDPMCSWCYGFAPELESLVEKYKDQMELELVNGGLRPYNKQPILELKGFLEHHWQDVNKASNQAFNYEILDRQDLNYDTEPSARAVVVVRHMNPKIEFEFFKLIQEAFYFQNKDLTNVESYFAILEALGLDKDEFTSKFHSDKFKELVKKDFQRASDLGVRGFPSLLLEVQGKLIVLSRGYTTADKINAAIELTLE